MMRLKDFDYELPPELIAQEPMEPRDHSRLFHYNRGTDCIDHDHFYNLTQYLRPDDVLVLNNTKVFPARLEGKKKTGGTVEVFLLRDFGGGLWQAMLGGARRKVGTEIRIADNLYATVVSKGREKIWMVQFNISEDQLWEAIYEYGNVPLPPYIKRKTSLDRYQTAYAQFVGSVAAPTAGFHLTKDLLEKLIRKGVEIEYVTLHVGLGTFAPVTSANIKEHQIHAEWGSIDEGTAQRLNVAREQGKRIIAVGTTSVRTLEHFSDQAGLLYAGRDWIDLFIYPGYTFKVVNGLITNFHLPKSSLIMLVAAFLCTTEDSESGIDTVKQLYAKAIAEKYRFYSYGDGMFVE